MNILKILRDKPWLHSTASATLEQYSGPDPVAASQIMLRFVLAIVGVLFFLFIITFLSRSQYPDFEALAGSPWQPFTTLLASGLTLRCLPALASLYSGVWAVLAQEN